MSDILSTGKRGTLCFAAFERGKATLWEVRRDGRVWLVYRTSVAVTLIGEYATPRDAYNEFYKHVEHIDDIEASLGR